MSYPDLTLLKARALLKKRKYPGTKDLNKAIAYLELGDEGQDILVFHPRSPEFYKPVITIPTATFQFMNENLPFLGMPLSIIESHILPLLDIPMRSRLAATCKRFYGVCMKSICSVFPLMFERLIEHNERRVPDNSYSFNLQKKYKYIVETGKGITPKAIEYAKELIRERRATAPQINFLLQSIHRYGSYERGLARSQLMQLVKKRIDTIIERNCERLNNAISEAGYFAARGTSEVRFSIDALHKLEYTLIRDDGTWVVNTWTFNASLYKKARESAEVLIDFVTKSEPFDWNTLIHHMEMLNSEPNGILFRKRPIKVKIRTITNFRVHAKRERPAPDFEELAEIQNMEPVQSKAVSEINMIIHDNGCIMCELGLCALNAGLFD